MLAALSVTRSRKALKKWIFCIALVVFTLSIVFWAFSPLLIAYAKVIPSGISFEACDIKSVEAAIIQAEHGAIEYLREIHGDSILVVSALAMLNALIAVFFICRAK